jgi:nucleotide-binding universal stress UspA family protein
MNIVLKVSKILIGTDGTEFSLKALHFSKDLACIYNSLITAFTAFNIPDKYKILEKEKEDYNTLSFEKRFKDQRDCC